MAYFIGSQTICGCWYLLSTSYEKRYLSLVDLKSHTTILATTSHTKLTQTFHNSQTKDALNEVHYTFPLYDNSTLVSFKCTIAGRTITGVVRERQQAHADYQAAVDRGETAGLLEQVTETSDAHTTRIGNIPANEQVIVEIEYLGELKHDAETDGSRFTLPTIIAPRYGSTTTELHSPVSAHGISISVDVLFDDGSIIRGIQSPSHPIAVTMGRISTTAEEDSFNTHQASATLTLGSAALEKDFVVVVLAKSQDTPRALLETHPKKPNQRALMATLVPKFNLPSIHPEIVFLVDRSGSMAGKIPTLVAALKVFLRSLPVGTRFNICSFGSHHKFMFKKSKIYDHSSLQEALGQVDGFAADFGGTEMYSAIEATFKNRIADMPLALLVLTDGQIWDQERLFEHINKTCSATSARVFSLGIGSGASSSLVEGIARSGSGFAQFVDDNKKMDKGVVRMLKGALIPHIEDYKLEVKYAKQSTGTDDDFEVVESVESDISKAEVDARETPLAEKKPISLFNPLFAETPTNSNVGRYDHLPSIAVPSILQAPHRIPSLYPFNRTTVYLLLGPDACQQTPTSVILHATSKHGPLELEIPIQDVGTGQTIHQLAAKKAMHDIEQGCGWPSASLLDHTLIGKQWHSRMDEIVEREAVRLGVEFQVTGKFCSFVAVEDGVEQVQASKYDFAEEAGEGPVTNGLRESRTKLKAEHFSLFSAIQSVSTDDAAHSGRGSGTRSGISCRSKKALALPTSTAFGHASSSSSASNQNGTIFQQRANAFSGPTPTPMQQAQMLRARNSQAPGALNAVPADFAQIPAQAVNRLSHVLPENVCSSFEDGDEGASSSNAAGLSNEDRVRALIDLNNFDGSWSLSERLSNIMGKDWNAIKDWKRAGWSTDECVTAMVIAYLEVRMAEEEDIWEMVVEKASKWLTENAGDAPEAIAEIKDLW